MAQKKDLFGSEFPQLNAFMAGSLVVGSYPSGSKKNMEKTPKIGNSKRMVEEAIKLVGTKPRVRKHSMESTRA